MTSQKTHRIVTELLATRGVEVHAAAMDMTLAQLGLDSLHVVELQLELEQLLDITLGEEDRVNGSLHTMTLAQFVAHVEACQAKPGDAPRP